MAGSNIKKNIFKVPHYDRDWACSNIKMIDISHPLKFTNVFSFFSVTQNNRFIEKRLHKTGNLSMFLQLDIFGKRLRKITLEVNFATKDHCI